MVETTHFICTHCGTDHSISNSIPSTGILTIYNNSLVFNCSNCGAQYHISVIVLEKQTSE